MLLHANKITIYRDIIEKSFYDTFREMNNDEPNKNHTGLTNTIESNHKILLFNLHEIDYYKIISCENGIWKFIYKSVDEKNADCIIDIKYAKRFHNVITGKLCQLNHRLIGNYTVKYKDKNPIFFYRFLSVFTQNYTKNSKGYRINNKSKKNITIKHLSDTNLILDSVKSYQLP